MNIIEEIKPIELGLDLVMPLTEAEKNQAIHEVIEEALSWVGTPYRFGCQEKGKGADCAEFELKPFKAARLIPEGARPPRAHRDAYLGKKVDRDEFRNYLLRYCVEVPYPTRRPSDIATFLVNGIERHVSIIVQSDPDMIVHAVQLSHVRKQRLHKIPTLKSIYRHKALI